MAFEFQHNVDGDGFCHHRIVMSQDGSKVLEWTELTEECQTCALTAARARLAKVEVVANIVLSTLIARCDEGWAVIQDAFQVARHDLFRAFTSAQPDEEVKPSPCPVCGGQGVICTIDETHPEEGFRVRTWVKCPDCAAQHDEEVKP